MLSIIDKLHAEGVGIIHITHNMAEAARAQKIVVMDQGQICMQGTPEAIFSRFEILQKMGLQLPQITELLIRLKQTGFPVRTDIVHMEDALKEIISMTARRKD